ncbi:CLUMA_CG010423, isoform A [Clunio marinus]|uniref:CLUMA_CG010423, isoform A n=1 Tax=Clunio marinus TaxID=568069 RepID=A0A1J1IB12_9DIPT|nr:CLUMA_CG010423, isoform A [Clunio marinus]
MFVKMLENIYNPKVNKQLNSLNPELIHFLPFASCGCRCCYEGFLGSLRACCCANLAFVLNI